MVASFSGYEQALAYRFPRRTDSVPEDRRFRHLRRVKRQLWTSADAQKQLLKAKLISMAVQHTIRPWQMSMKQCHFQWLKQRIWGQSPGQSGSDGEASLHQKCCCWASLVWEACLV